MIFRFGIVSDLTLNKTSTSTKFIFCGGSSRGTKPKSIGGAGKVESDGLSKVFVEVIKLGRQEEECLPYTQELPHPAPSVPVKLLKH